MATHGKEAGAHWLRSIFAHLSQCITSCPHAVLPILADLPLHAPPWRALATGIAGHAHRSWGDEFTERAIIVRVVALVMLFVSILLAVWAGLNFQKRAMFLE